MTARLPCLLAALLPLALSLPTGASEFVIRQNDNDLSVSGTLSSTAHRELLEAAAAEKLPHMSATFDLHRPAEPTPPGWSLVTREALTSVAGLDQAIISISASRLHLRGLRRAGWRATRASLERVLLPGMTLVDDTLAISDDETFSQLCRRQLEAAVARGRVVFRLSSAELSPASLPLLDALVELLADCRRARLRVIGHTDASGSVLINQAISENRARAVVRYLQDHGIAADRLQAIGKGATEPLTPGDTRAARAQNRRIEFRIELPD